MRKKGRTVEDMIMRSHYLNALELESEAENPLSEMEREAFLETIRDLKESVQNANEMIRSLQATIRGLQSELERSRSHSERYLALNTELHSLIADLQKRLDEREKEISDLRDLNNRHNKMTFGNKSTSRKHKRPARARGREEEKEDCDGPDSAVSGETGPKESEAPLDTTKVKSEHLDARRGPRGLYTQMDAAKKVVLESSLEGVPVDWVFDHLRCLPRVLPSSASGER